MNVPEEWLLEDGGKALVRSFKFKDFSEAFAFLTRVVDSRHFEPSPLFDRTDSPMHALVRAAYAGPGVRVLGQGAPRTDVENGFAEVFVMR